MPTSHPCLLTPVITTILESQPKSVLDIGIGCGKWGALIREYTDIWYRRWDKDSWQTRIEGIEIFSKYKTPNWDWYDAIHFGDATRLIDSCGKFDLIVCIEVLEHIEKPEALFFIEKLLKHSKTLLISFTNSPQGAAFGNPYERHVSTWRFSDFGKLAPSKCLLSTDNDSKQLIKMCGLVE
jgi:2-polyprenyl-3-methyl-5-hydroxy-6-metoxy-1,4-benzoquinol methylase